MIVHAVVVTFELVVAAAAAPSLVSDHASAPYEAAGFGVFGSEVTWNVGGAQGKGVRACYEAVLAEAGCAKDFFTYVHRGDKNCGCSLPTAEASIRSDGVSTYYRIKADMKPAAAIEVAEKQPQVQPQQAAAGQKDEVAYSLHSGPGSECCDTGVLSDSESEGLAECQSRCEANSACHYISHWSTGGTNWCRLTTECSVKGTQNHHTISIYAKQVADWSLPGLGRRIPFGNGDYEKIGVGACQDSSGREFTTFERDGCETVEECVKACNLFGSSECRGFSMGSEYSFGCGRCELRMEATVINGSPDGQWQLFSRPAGTPGTGEVASSTGDKKSSCYKRVTDKQSDTNGHATAPSINQLAAPAVNQPATSEAQSKVEGHEASAATATRMLASVAQSNVEVAPDAEEEQLKKLKADVVRLMGEREMLRKENDKLQQPISTPQEANHENYVKGVAEIAKAGSNQVPLGEHNEPQVHREGAAQEPDARAVAGGGVPHREEAQAADPFQGEIEPGEVEAVNRKHRAQRVESNSKEPQRETAELAPASGEAKRAAAETAPSWASEKAQTQQRIEEAHRESPDFAPAREKAERESAEFAPTREKVQRASAELAPAREEAQRVSEELAPEEEARVNETENASLRVNAKVYSAEEGKTHAERDRYWNEKVETGDWLAHVDHPGVFGFDDPDGLKDYIDDHPNKIFGDPLRDVPPPPKNFPKTKAEWDLEVEKYEEKLERRRKKNETATSGTILCDNFLEHGHLHLSNISNCDVAVDAMMALIPDTKLKCFEERGYEGEQEAVVYFKGNTSQRNLVSWWVGWGGELSDFTIVHDFNETSMHKIMFNCGGAPKNIDKLNQLLKEKVNQLMEAQKTRSPSDDTDEGEETAIELLQRIHMHKHKDKDPNSVNNVAPPDPAVNTVFKKAKPEEVTKLMEKDVAWKDTPLDYNGHCPDGFYFDPYIDPDHGDVCRYDEHEIPVKWTAPRECEVVKTPPWTVFKESQKVCHTQVFNLAAEAPLVENKPTVAPVAPEAEAPATLKKAAAPTVPIAPDEEAPATQKKASAPMVPTAPDEEAESQSEEPTPTHDKATKRKTGSKSKDHIKDGKRKLEVNVNADLTGLKLSALKRKAKEEQISDEEVEQVDDADDPVKAAIELIVEARKRKAGSAQPTEAESKDQQEEPPEDATPKVVSNEQQKQKPKRNAEADAAWHLPSKPGGLIDSELSHNNKHAAKRRKGNSKSIDRPHASKSVVRNTAHRKVSSSVLQLSETEAEQAQSQAERVLDTKPKIHKHKNHHKKHPINGAAASRKASLLAEQKQGKPADHEEDTKDDSIEKHDKAESSNADETATVKKPEASTAKGSVSHQAHQKGRKHAKSADKAQASESTHNGAPETTSATKKTKKKLLRHDSGKDADSLDEKTKFGSGEKATVKKHNPPTQTDESVQEQPLTKAHQNGKAGNDATANDRKNPKDENVGKTSSASTKTSEAGKVRKGNDDKAASAPSHMPKAGTVESSGTSHDQAESKAATKTKHKVSTSAKKEDAPAAPDTGKTVTNAREMIQSSSDNQNIDKSNIVFEPLPSWKNLPLHHVNHSDGVTQDVRARWDKLHAGHASVQQSAEAASSATASKAGGATSSHPQADSGQTSSAPRRMLGSWGNAQPPAPVPKALHAASTHDAVPAPAPPLMRREARATLPSVPTFPGRSLLAKRSSEASLARGESYPGSVALPGCPDTKVVQCTSVMPAHENYCEQYYMSDDGEYVICGIEYKYSKALGHNVWTGRCFNIAEAKGCQETLMR